MLLRKAYRDLVTRRVRSFLTLVGVVVGVAGLVAIVTTTRGFARAQQETFTSGDRADLAIFLFNAPESVVRVVQRVDGVVAADLRSNLYAPGRLGEEAAWGDLHFMGIRDFEQQVADRIVLEAGEWPEREEALIEPAAAAQYGLHIGDTIYYRNFASRETPLRLSGIARLPSALSSDLTNLPLIFVRPAVTSDINNVPGFNELVVRLDDSRPHEESANAILAELGLRNIPRGAPRFSDPDSFPGKRELDALFIALYLFSGLGVLLTGFIVANTLSALVSESIREIGILKSIGATRAQVLGSFLLTAALYGVAGTTLGSVTGSLLGYGLLNVLGRAASLDPPFRVEPVALLLGALVGMLVTIAGGLIPAWRAASITAKEALESRGVSRNFGRSKVDRRLQRLASLPPLPAMGFRNLVRRKGRSVVTLLVVALAVSALLAAQATDRSVAAAINEIFATYRADAYLQFGETATREETGALRRVAGVNEVEAWLLRTCTARFARTRCWALPANTTFYRPNLLAGWWLDPRDPLGVVISDDLAVSQKLHVGDSFPLRYREMERSVAVRGIVRDNAIFLGSDIQSKVFIPHTTFAPMIGANNAADVFAFTLDAEDPEAQAAILDEIDRKLATLRPSSTLALSEFETAREQTRILTAALRAMVLLVALVGASGLLNTLALNVLERRREIGVLRALGTDNRQLTFLFLAEGVGLGALGWVCGLFVGWGVGKLFVAAFSSALFEIAYRFPAPLVLSSFLFALLLSLAASIAPALAAASIPTVEAIRYE